MAIFDGTHTNYSYSAGLAPGLMQQYYRISYVYRELFPSRV